MNSPVTPPPPEHSPDTQNRSITILRIVLWLIPAGFIPVSAILIGLIGNVLRPTPFLHSNLLITLWILALVAATAAIGYFDQRLLLMQKKIAPPFDKAELVRWTIVFVLAQIIIAPLILIVFLFGFCAVTGTF